MPSILLINGPNLNLLGTREPDLYGHDTLETIVQRLDQLCRQERVSFDAFQSNAEHEIVDRIHQAGKEKVSMILINPAAFTHTSLSIRDAFQATAVPFIEIHLSNVYARERYRQKSYLSDIARGVICGFGPSGYELALQAAIRIIQNQR